MGKLRLHFLTVLLCLSTVSILAQGNEALQRYSFAATTQYYDADGKSLGFIEFSRILRDYPSAQLKIRANNEDILERIDVLSYKKATELVTKSPKVVNPVKVKKKVGTTVVPEAFREKEKPVHIIYDAQRKANYENEIGSPVYFTTAKELEKQKAPYFLADILNKASKDNLEMKGKVIVLKFWFTTCIPCIQELPELNQLHRIYSPKGVQFLAPSIDSKTKTEAFLRQHAFKYDIVLNGEDLAADYKVAGYPTHVVINPTGAVQKVLVGENSMTYKILKQAIEFSLHYKEDDLLIEELQSDVISFTTGMVIEDDKGKKLTEMQYVKKLQTNRYKIYKRIKKTGEEQLLLLPK